MSDLLTLDRDERGVYTLTIRRPEVRNALNAQAFREGLDALQRKRRPIFGERSVERSR